MTRETMIARLFEEIPQAHEGQLRKAANRIIAEQAKEKPTEPLAVLADRKGYHISRQMCRFKTTSPEWIINLEPNVYENNPANFFQPTYALAEAKARAYLMALEDKEGV